jgi:hypothetical protein
MTIKDILMCSKNPAVKDAMERFDKEPWNFNRCSLLEESCCNSVSICTLAYEYTKTTFLLRRMCFD